jgi:hypothetical protein
MLRLHEDNNSGISTDSRQVLLVHISECVILNFLSYIR